MGKFEQNAQTHMDELDAKISEKYRERGGLDWGHDCDCEFCDREEMPPEETEEQAAKIDAEIKEIENMQMRLKKHAQLSGIEILTAKEKRERERERTTRN